MTKELITIGICAHNAAATIERAVASVLAEKNCQLLLVDDHCTDDTVARACALAGDRLRVVAVAGPGGVAVARQTGLDAMTTLFGTWLDADDEWIPGRAERFVAALQGGADVITEPIELYDGPTGKYLRRLDVPAFIVREVTPGRLFERNYLPCDTQVGFRLALFRHAGGYDLAIDVSESFDILLRAVVRGARFHYGAVPGYKMYAYPGSLSRQIDRMRTAVTALLKKHDYDEVRRICMTAGEAPRVAAWVLVSMAMFRKEWTEALKFLQEASPIEGDPDLVLEPDGPWPFREGWRRAFQGGTICLMIPGRDAEAAQQLEKACRIEPTAEGLNNWGVALSRLRQLTAAQDCFAESQKLFPGYLDAKLNSESEKPMRITTHPLRRQASRSEYAAATVKKAER